MTQIREMNAFPNDGHVQVDGLDFDLELLNRYGYIEGTVDVQEAIDPTLLDEALAGES